MNVALEVLNQPLYSHLECLKSSLLDLVNKVSIGHKLLIVGETVRGEDVSVHHTVPVVILLMLLFLYQLLVRLIFLRLLLEGEESLVLGGVLKNVIPESDELILVNDEGVHLLRHLAIGQVGLG